jgi:hypothetical protein
MKIVTTTLKKQTRRDRKAEEIDRDAMQPR